MPVVIIVVAVSYLVPVIMYVCIVRQATLLIGCHWIHSSQQEATTTTTSSNNNNKQQQQAAATKRSTSNNNNNTQQTETTVLIAVAHSAVGRMVYIALEAHTTSSEPRGGGE